MKKIEIEVPDGYIAKQYTRPNGVKIDFVKEEVKDLMYYIKKKWGKPDKIVYIRGYMFLEGFTLDKFVDFITPGDYFDLFLFIRDELGGKPSLNEKITTYTIAWRRDNRKYEINDRNYYHSSIQVSSPEIAQQIIDIMGTEVLDKLFKS